MYGKWLISGLELLFAEKGGIFYPQGVRVCRDEYFSHTGKKTSSLIELCAWNERSEWARDKGFGL